MNVYVIGTFVFLFTTLVGLYYVYIVEDKYIKTLKKYNKSLEDQQRKGEFIEVVQDYTEIVQSSWVFI